MSEKKASTVNRTQENQYKTILPAEVVRDLDLEVGQEISVVPECKDSQLSLVIDPNPSGDGANHRKLTGEGRDMHQTVLRFPTSLAEPLGLEGKNIEWMGTEDGNLVGKVTESDGGED